MTEETKMQGISARQLLARVYASLKNDGKEVKLSPPAMSEIGNDSDYHRTRIGYFGYESAVLAKIGEKEYAIAFGMACGDYPAYPYDCDIAAVPISTEDLSNEAIADLIRANLEAGSYFYNSLTFAMADGNLAISKSGRFGEKIAELVKPKIKDFTAQKLEINPDFIHPDGRPLVASPFKYKPEFIGFLSDAFRTILSG